MSSPVLISRRKFLHAAAVGSASLCFRPKGSARWLSETPGPSVVLDEFGYGDVSLDSPLHEDQLRQTHSVLMGLDDDALMKPFRAMIGQPSPGEDLGGWYRYDPNFDWHTFDSGFAPTSTFGQWVSALSRAYAITGSQAAREKVLRLNRLYAQVIDDRFYGDKNRFPAYAYDKIVCGLIDAHKYAGDPLAWEILGKATDAVLPHLPPKAVEHGTNWRPGKDESFNWDESYTMPENLLLAYHRGAGERYRTLAIQYLNEPFYDRLADGQNDLAGRHAYSHINCLCSAMQAYLALGNEKYLRAARNGFDMMAAQSFATGGWGPDELLRKTDTPDIFESLKNTHNSFETPCGAYAHFKLTRYLLRVTLDPRYGDSMERMMYNTILGALPLQQDGRTFYYSDYNLQGKKVYSNHRWPCCSGTMPQVTADYRINTYFRDERGVYVNLYIPSTVRWNQGGTQVELTQRSEYPYDSQIQFELKTSKPVSFALKLRIPAWAEGGSLATNGKRAPASSGTFANIEREWRNGERVELELPMRPRLEPIDAQHPDVVALIEGPLVLFAEQAAGLTRAQLLNPRKIAPGVWQVSLGGGRPMKMVPWTALAEDQPYTTYLRVT